MSSSRESMKARFDPVGFVEQHGVVLAAARGPVPSVAEAIAGEPIRGSWWGHEKGSQIFRGSFRHRRLSRHSLFSARGRAKSRSSTGGCGARSFALPTLSALKSWRRSAKSTPPPANIGTSSYRFPIGCPHKFGRAPPSSPKARRAQSSDHGCPLHVPAATDSLRWRPSPCRRDTALCAIRCDAAKNVQDAPAPDGIVG